ncbi:transcriptional regulator [Flavobacterium sp. IR1]|nr:transcriptional regulator [Flavobacterium sp. IR1]
MSTLNRPNHIGRKISRIREIKDMKQEALAHAMGTNQQAISIMENSDTIEEDKLIEVAKALGVSVEVIKNFSEEGVLNYFDNSSNSGAIAINASNCTFNPLDKLIEAHEKQIKLYERLIQAEKEKTEYWEKLAKQK